MKPPVLVGCAGFPVGQARYYADFPAVEVNTTFIQPPRLPTLERWRAEAPKEFRFTVKAWQLITHPDNSPGYRKMTAKLAPSRLALCGHFQNTEEVRRAWAATLACARALKASVVLFETPPSFYPNPDLLRAMYRFFKDADRGDLQFAWDPRGESWKTPLIRQVCADLGLIHANDPLDMPSAHGRVQYFRLRGAYRDRHVVQDHSYSEQELERLAALCRAKAAYVFFHNTQRHEDAKRFQALLEAV